MSTLLVIDSGNSRIKWALADRSELGPIAAVDREASLAPLQEAAEGAGPVPAVGCDVAGASQRRKIEQAVSRPCRWIDAAATNTAGVRSRYRSGQLGADRWCALLGLRQRHGWGIAVTAGTAITVDFLAEDGVFHGGLILPGRRLMHEALAAATALPAVAADADMAEPLSTEAAIAAGSLHAAAGAVRAFAQQHQVAETRIFLCGGSANSLALLLPESNLDLQLVLRGIVVAAAD